VNEATHAELRALRERVAELERLAADTRGPMYSESRSGLSIEKQNQLAQDELTARAWKYDEQMEAVVGRLEKNRDDPAVTPGMRVASALYRVGKSAAARHGLPTGGTE
jgi:hypothetical protein